jgi:hypothetical protein
MSYLSFSAMKKLLLLSLAVMALGACKKDDSSSRTYLLTSKNWRVSAATNTLIVNGQPVVTDTYATYPACDRDDFYRFNSNNSVVRDQGLLKCNASAPQTVTGPWSFNSAQTQLSFLPIGYATQAGDIIELSASTLHLRISPPAYGPLGSPPDPTVDLIYTAF